MAAIIFLTSIEVGDEVAARRRAISCHEGALELGRVVGRGWDAWHQAPTVVLEVDASTSTSYRRSFRASELVAYQANS